MLESFQYFQVLLSVYLNIINIFEINTNYIKYNFVKMSLISL